MYYVSKTAWWIFIKFETVLNKNNIFKILIKQQFFYVVEYGDGL